MIDIGGGSTEFVVGDAGGDPEFHVSTRMGSVRHTERHLHSDPPTAAELAALARTRARSWRPTSPPTCAERGAGIAVAGTATSLAAIDQRLDPYDPERVHGYRLGWRLRAAAGALAALPSPSAAGSPACIPTAPRRSSPARDPARVDARLRARRDRGLRERHPPRRRAGRLKMKAPASCRRLQTAPSGRAGVRAMKGPCGSSGGRRRYDAASPEPMYRVKADGFAAQQHHPARPTITPLVSLEKGAPGTCVYTDDG